LFHLLGLTDVVLTNIAPVMPALKRNLKHNKPVFWDLCQIVSGDWDRIESCFELLVPAMSFAGMSLARLESSLMETCKESLKRTSRSVVFIVSKEEMLE